MKLDELLSQTYFDGDVHRAPVRFPIGVNGHSSDPHQLPRQVVPFVRLDEGEHALGLKVQKC